MGELGTNGLTITTRTNRQWTPGIILRNYEEKTIEANKIFKIFNIKKGQICLLL